MSRKQILQLRNAADEALFSLTPHCPPWTDASAWYWACQYMLRSDRYDRMMAERYCADYLRDLKAGQVRYP